MTHLFRTALLAAMLATSVTLAAETTEEIQTARGIVKDFAGRLQGELKQAIDARGFEHAIGVCKRAAPEIAAEVSAESGWRVGRTALRVRNPANAPNTEERAILEDFLSRATAGEPLAGLENTAVVERDGRRSLHYMKAIPLGEICATCHGTDIDPDLAATIRHNYPDDKATGFKVGDLRGAFTLYKLLD